MNLREMRMLVLTELYNSYKVYGAGTVSLNDILAPHGVSFQDVYELGSYLKEEGTIKDVQFRPRETVGTISIAGIEVVDPFYFEQHISSIVSVSGLTGHDWMGVRETLQWEPAHDVRARDIVKVLEFKGLIEAPQYQDDVYIKLNLKGRDYYERKKASF